MKNYVDYIKESVKEDFMESFSKFITGNDDWVEVDASTDWFTQYENIRKFEGIDEDDCTIWTLKEKFKDLDVALVCVGGHGGDQYYLAWLKGQDQQWKDLWGEPLSMISPYDVLKEPKVIISKHDPYGEEDWED